MKILDWLQEYCEERHFRLTYQNKKLHLVWLVESGVRTAEFDDVSEMLDFVEIRSV